MPLFIGTQEIGNIGIVPAKKVTDGVNTSDATLNSGAQMLQGVTAYAKGLKYTGTIPIQSEAQVTISGNEVQIQPGYYETLIKKTIAKATLSKPTIKISDSGLVTANVVQAISGYLSYGDSSSETYQLQTKSESVITPGTANQYISSKTYLTGQQTILGDSNLKPENILSPATIFGVKGGVVAQKYYTGLNAPSNSLGNDGDIYLQM